VSSEVVEPIEDEILSLFDDSLPAKTTPVGPDEVFAIPPVAAVPAVAPVIEFAQVVEPAV
jgi:hypothetical protein